MVSNRTDKRLELCITGQKKEEGRRERNEWSQMRISFLSIFRWSLFRYLIFCAFSFHHIVLLLSLHTFSPFSHSPALFLSFLLCLWLQTVSNLGHTVWKLVSRLSSPSLSFIHSVCHCFSVGCWRASLVGRRCFGYDLYQIWRMQDLAQLQGPAASISRKERRRFPLLYQPQHAGRNWV